MFVTKKRFQEAIDNGDKNIVSLKEAITEKADDDDLKYVEDKVKQLEEKLATLEKHFNILYEPAKTETKAGQYRKKTKKDKADTYTYKCTYIDRMLSRINDTY